MAVLELDGLGIPFGILSPNKMYSADAYAGPYNNKQDAMDTVKEAIRVVGREVGIYAPDGRTVEKYNFILTSNNEWDLVKSNTQLPTLISAFTNDVGYITLDDVVIPTQVSAFNNDAGYITSSDIPTKLSLFLNDTNFITLADIPTVDLSGYYTKTEIDSKLSSVYKFKGSVADNDALPSINNTIGDVYNVIETDMNYAWTGTAWDALGSSYQIPENVSAFVNDAGYLTNTDITGKLDKPAAPYTGSHTYVVVVDGEGNSAKKPLDEFGQSGGEPNVITSIKRNGTTLVVNEDKSVNLEVPTKVSDLTNDEGYITLSEVPVFNDAITSIKLNGSPLTIGADKSVNVEVPTNTNQLTNDAGFITAADVQIPTLISAFTNDVGYAKLTDIPSIPTNISFFNNDAGYITLSSLPTKISELTNDSGFISDSDLTIKTISVNNVNIEPDSFRNVNINVPTKTSQITNDSGFITSSYLPTKVSQLQNDAGYITLSEIPQVNIPLTGVQVNGVDLTIDANKKVNVIVPKKVSDLNNDAGYITLSQVPTTDISGKLDKVTSTTTLDQVYVKNKNGQQTMLDVTAVGRVYISPDDSLLINGNEIKFNLAIQKETFELQVDFALPINITTVNAYKSITNIFFNGVALDESDYEIISATQYKITRLSESILALFMHNYEVNKITIQGIVQVV